MGKGYSSQDQDVPMPRGFAGDHSDFTIIRRTDSPNTGEDLGDCHKNAYHVGNRENTNPGDC